MAIHDKKHRWQSISKNVSRDISRLRAQYDKNSVIASERSERGNPQCNTANIDCHESASADSRNDESPYWAKYFTNSRNDKSTHPLAPRAKGGGIFIVIVSAIYCAWQSSVIIVRI
ncbi:hypothetical protein [Helicobacter sp. T3_23-1056]